MFRPKKESYSCRGTNYCQKASNTVNFTVLVLGISLFHLGLFPDELISRPRVVMPNSPKSGGLKCVGFPRLHYLFPS
jgi:hypothetical protein